MSEPIAVDVWSDVACPWCYIGKRQLEAGIDAYAERSGALPVRVEFHSFELSPDTPVEFEGSAAEFLARHKGLPEAHARQMQEQVAAIAATVGLGYDFESLKPANTLKAHQVLHLAKTRGVQGAVKERLLRAHFVEGRHVGRDAELADLAAEDGLDREEVLRCLQEQEQLAAVRADQRRALELGIRGVPFFVIDGRYGISGAQPSESFTGALERAAADRQAEAI